MTKLKKALLWISGSAFVVFAFGSPFFLPHAHANTLVFPPSVVTNSTAATSTLTFMTPGTATTTLTLDSYGSGQPYATEGATVFVIDNASSSSSILNMAVQYSQNGIDWYQDNINNSTTSALLVPNSYNYASAASGAKLFAFQIQTPVRYARVVFSAVGGNIGFFGQITPKRQSPAL